MSLNKKRFEILEFLPVYGPMYVPISHTGLSFFSAGFVVQFYNDDGSNWVAIFEPGLTSLCGVFDFPVFDKTVVFSNGACFIVTARKKDSIESVGFDFSHVYKTNDEILIAANQINFTVLEIENDKVWTSERISWDGFKDLKFEGDFISGLALDPRKNNGNGEWEKFSFNYRTLKVIGGTW